MKRLMLALSTVLTIAAVKPSSIHARSANVAGAAQNGTSLYQAAFKSRGLKGWTQYPVGSATTSSWHVNRNGVLIFNGPAQGASEVQAPFSVAHLPNFAVQTQIEAIGSAADPFSGFGVVVQNADQPATFTPASTATGVMGGYYGSPRDAELVWGPEEVGGAAPTVHPGYNTFRVEVHGSDYSLFINGQLIVSFPIALSQKGAHIGLWALSQKLQVKSFQVLRLSSAAALPPVPPIKALSLGPGDVPGDFLMNGHAYYATAAEVARPRNVSTAQEIAAGFVLGYGVAYVAPVKPFAGTFLVDSEINQYSTAENAQAAWSSDWPMSQSFLKSTTPSLTNYASGDISGVGDEAHWSSYDLTVPGYGTSFSGSILGIFFRRGPYEEFVEEGFIQGSVSHDEMLKEVLALAQIVDKRSQ